MTKREMKASFDEYAAMLRQREIREQSINKYLSDLRRFLDFPLQEEEIHKADMIAFKAALKKRYKPSSVNSFLLSINRYMQWRGRPDLKLRLERIQRSYSLSNVLEMEDYHKLLDYAKESGKEKYYYLMKTLAGTGIRVGELQFITREAAAAGVVSVDHKGKNREICIPAGLSAQLSDYCERNGIGSGVIFTGRDRKRPMDVSGIWKGLKRLAVAAGVEEKRVYPHSFRHLFAKVYMKEIGNLTELCDILGHSSMETTRIYTKETVREKRDSLEKLHLLQ